MPETDDPTVQWREAFETDSDASMSFESPPVVTDDAIVVAGAEGAREFCPPAETTGNAIVSLARSSQERQWSYDVGMPVTRGLDVAGETVIAGTADHLLALDATDGSVQWQVADDVSVTAAFVHDDDTVYAPITSGSSSETSLVALDAATGTERWRFDGSDSALSKIDDLAIGDGQVYAELDDEDTVVALDAATGDRNWRVTGSYVDLDGASDGFVVTGDIGDSVTDRQLVSRKASDGSEEWRTDIERGIDEVGIVSDGDTLYVPNIGFGGLKRGLDAVDLTDGSVRWSNPLSEFERDYTGATTDPRGYHTAAPVIAENVVYLSYERFVIAIDQSDGTVRNYYEGDADVGGVAPGDDTVYVTDAGGKLTALDPLV